MAKQTLQCSTSFFRIILLKDFLVQPEFLRIEFFVIRDSDNQKANNVVGETQRY